LNLLFVFSASQLSALLVKKAGSAIVTECQSNPILKTNECRVTSGGNTQFRNIVHFITPQANILAQNLLNVLILIDSQLKKNSVAIPAIGAGMTVIRA